MAHSVILRRSNKWDSAGDVLRQEQRQWELCDHQREAHMYVKRKEVYWNEEIKESRKKRAKSHLDLQSSEVHNQEPSMQSTTDAPPTDTPTAGNNDFQI